MEGIGYDFVEAPDHVLGVNAASRPGWDRNDNEDLFHDPFVLGGYLAGCTQKLGFSTGVLILPQRQTVLVAKQAACLDVLSGGKFRLGIGVGWNEVEYVGLNENFHNRGRRSEEQVQVMQALWAQPHVTFKGRYHTIDDAGINPRPASGRVPVWYGGHHDLTLPRIAKWGDGWMPNAYPPDQTALDVFEKLRTLTREAGRDPASVGIEVWTSCGSGTAEDWRKEALFWKSAGASHLCLTTTFNRRTHRRIEGHTPADHLGAARRYREAVAEAL
jgi:probable F420-dependent oxidoreductase